MGVDVAVRHRLGNFELDAAFQSKGRLTALFGPSGSGKTSLINILGGLLKPQQGRVAVDATVFVDTERHVFVPTHKRRIGYVFQDARLFPHLTVAQNLGYGRWFTPARERTAQTGLIVEMLGIGNLMARRPDALSGGEKQRVAIGRALACSPRLLLMDEPLASLDDARKAEILPYIERLRDEARIPIVYVSHSIAEVARLADDIVMLERGRVAAAGPASQVLLRTDLLADQERIEGGAILEMSIVGQDTDYRMTLLRSAAGDMRVPQIAGANGQTVRLRLRARDVMLALKEPQAISGLNILRGKVTAIREDASGNVDVTVGCGGQPILARITRLSRDRLAIKPGLPVYAIVKSVSFDREAAALAMRGPET